MIRVGIGGWNYEPWRKTFYPEGLSKARELEYASRQVTSIEINSTYYSSQKPETFRRWAEQTPDNFMFSVKASRFTTNRRSLADAGESVLRFVQSGITQLGPKLGPILWQFAPTKKFDAEDFGAFLDLLPQKQDGIALRHAVEVRHETFVGGDFVALARKHNVAVVLADSAKYPLIADLTADFVYIRLQQAQAEIATGYSAPVIKQWAGRAKAWEKGGAVSELPLLSAAAKPKKRDVFVYMINGAKERAPAAAQALIKVLQA